MVKRILTAILAGLLLGWGLCDAKTPGEVSSRKVYDQLLKRFKQRFGEPSEWRGDPFHVVIAWKWQFTEPDGRCISLTLQHNTRDEEEKMGNAVKLTATHLIEAERRCFTRQHPDPTAEGRPQLPPGPVDWELLVPR